MNPSVAASTKPRSVASMVTIAALSSASGSISNVYAQFHIRPSFPAANPRDACASSMRMQIVIESDMAR